MSRRAIFSLLPVLGCFVLAAWSMRHDWTFDETYHYGWTVGPLTAYLVFNRWRERPSPQPAAPSPWRTSGWLAVSLLIILSWLLREANPDWRLVGVALTFAAIAASWLWLTDWGGPAWRRHFGGAVAFFAIAIPWPSVLEKAVTGLLMPVNAAIALEALHWLGVPAVRQGNLIMLQEGTLGVEEACSGIRSLQATLMMALFLGEMHGLRWIARLGMLAAGMLTALLTNAVRTTFLSAMAARSGLAAANQWHDRAGITVLVANALVLFLLTKLLSRKFTESAPAEAPNLSAGVVPSLRGPAICAAALLLLGPLVFFWYGLREQQTGPQWTLAAPESAPRFRFVSIDKRTSFMLRSSRGWSAKWNTPEGHPVHSYYFEWDPGRAPPENMNVHTPGGCLSNLGIELDRELAPLSLEIGGMALAPRLLRFVDRGMPLYVVYLVTGADPARKDAEAFDFSYSRRLRAVLRGLRNSGQRMLEIGIWGEASEAAARRELTDLLQQQIRPAKD